MTEVISVRFRGGCKNYYFDPKGLQVKMGDQVIVETTQGAEFATCTEANHEVADEAIVQPLCAVLRMATENAVSFKIHQKGNQVISNCSYSPSPL